MNQNSLNNLLELYNYKLPPKLIAQKPAKPRDSAKLLIYNRQNRKTNYSLFKNLGKYLPKDAVLVFNQTKVWPARLKIQKLTGGLAELLYISHDKNFIRALSSRKLTPGQTIMILNGRSKSLWFKVAKKQGQFYFLKPGFSISRIPDVLKKHGLTPLPPYIKNSPLTEKQKRQQYQTVFAKTGLSVAAPTASLHFTKKLLAELKKRGIDEKFVRLDVGLGTFAPLKAENLETGKLHQEFYFIDPATAEFLNQAKKQGQPIIAVGTTVARTLESSSKTSGTLTVLQGNTNLFIQHNYKFKFIDGLITNFHVPKSSLMMLVAALTGREQLLNIYQKAINKKFRFFSFGDGMLIL